MKAKNASFGLKEVVGLIMFTVSIVGVYYTLDKRIALLEQDKTVANIEEQVKKNAKLTRAIYDGLLSKGIIKPQ